MITKFKLFENNETIQKELVDQLSDDDIEEYFPKYYHYDIDEIWSNFPQTVIDNIDDDKFMEDFISDYIDGRELEEFGDYDLKRYIKENFDDLYNDVKQVYLNNIKDEDDNDESEEELDDSILDDFSEDDLREVIENNGCEYEFKKYVVEGWYDRTSASDIIDEFYGDVDKLDKDQKEKLYDWISQYVDDSKVEKDFADSESFDYKQEIVGDNIYREEKLQKKLLKMNPSNVLNIFELIKDYPKDSIGEEYDFQNTYIEEYVNDYFDNDFEGYEEDEINEIKAKALVKLDKYFELDSDIKSEYEEHMWMVHSSKYNL